MNTVQEVKRMNAIRKLKREVAKTRLKKAGIKHLCRQEAKGHKTHNSYFSKHWREAVRKDKKR